MDNQQSPRSPERLSSGLLIVELDCSNCRMAIFPPIAIDPEDMEAFEEGLKSWKCSNCQRRGTVVIVSKEVES